MKTIAAVATVLTLLMGLSAVEANAEGCTYVTDPGESYTPDLTTDRCIVLTMSSQLTINNPVNAADGTIWTLIIHNEGANPIFWDTAYKATTLFGGWDGGMIVGRVVSADGVQYLNAYPATNYIPN